VGQFFIAISPGGFTPGGENAYAERLETMLSALAAEPGVRLPGTRRHESRLRAETEGVEVPIELIDRLEGFAAAG
jgi:(2R)-3-sulfolactate dehydrogenase (NADP+)